MEFMQSPGVEASTYRRGRTTAGSHHSEAASKERSTVSGAEEMHTPGTNALRRMPPVTNVVKQAILALCVAVSKSQLAASTHVQRKSPLSNQQLGNWIP